MGGGGHFGRADFYFVGTDAQLVERFTHGTDRVMRVETREHKTCEDKTRKDM